MNFNSFGRSARNHGQRGRGRGGRGGRRGGRGRGGRNHGHHAQNNGNKNFNHVHYIESSGTVTSSSFNVAVQGCSHGELDSIYAALQAFQTNSGWGADDPDSPSVEIDVLLCCGDVQTLRNTDDYHALAVPNKYKAMGDFHQYYSGAKVAPILTVMIGGNHESSNYLQELYYGGWVAPNIYYLGAAGVVNLCKWSVDRKSVSTLRIAGISGIYKSHDYKLGRFEVPPYSQNELRSVYHTRHFEVERLRALSFSSEKKPIDIMISHDWPRGIEQHGNIPQLIQQKPFFKQEIESNSLGSPANETLLHSLRPSYWFAAHLHVKFQAAVKHGNRDESAAEGGDDKKPEAVSNANESTNFVGMESNEGICPDPNVTNMESLTDQMTRFLSLDKCLPKRRHLQVLHIEPSSSRLLTDEQTNTETESNKSWLEYDPTWLAIHRRTEDWSKPSHNVLRIPKEEFEQNPITPYELQDIMNRLQTSVEGKNDSQDNNPMAIPLNFVQTVRPYDLPSSHQYGPPREMIGNPQTDTFLEMMGMEHKLTVPFRNDGNAEQAFFRASLAMPAPQQTAQSLNDDNEISLDEEDAPDAQVDNNKIPRAPLMPAPVQNAGDENEIDLDADEDNAGDEGEKSAENAAIGKVTSSVPTDPDEINLEEDIDAEAGDSVCYSTETSSKRPRV